MKKPETRTERIVREQLESRTPKGYTRQVKNNTRRRKPGGNGADWLPTPKGWTEGGALNFVIMFIVLTVLGVAGGIVFLYVLPLINALFG